MKKSKVINRVLILSLSTVLCAGMCQSQAQSWVYDDVEIVDQIDTLYINGSPYACYLERVGEFEVVYRLPEANEPRSITRTLVSRLVDNRDARRFVSIDPARLKGKKIYISITPIEKKGRYKALVDTGTNAGISVLHSEAEELAFNSELAVVNWFVMQGWEMYEIIDFMEAEGTGSKVLGSFIGIDFKDWQVTKEYVMWKIL